MKKSKSQRISFTFLPKKFDGLEIYEKTYKGDDRFDCNYSCKSAS